MAEALHNVFRFCDEYQSASGTQGNQTPPDGGTCEAYLMANASFASTALGTRKQRQRGNIERLDAYFRGSRETDLGISTF